jgi:polar amino acid transport system substrate-binding protein
VWRYLLIAIVITGSVLAEDTYEEIRNLSVISEQYAPLNFKEGTEVGGLSVEILQLIYEQLDVPFPDIEFMPWARGFHLAQSEQPVMLFTMSRTPAREDMFQWVGHTHTARTFLVTWQGSGISRYDPTSEHSERILAVASDITEYVLKEMGYPEQKIDTVDSNEIMFNMASKKRVKLLSVSEARFNEMRTSEAFSDITFEVLAVTREIRGHFAFSKAVNPEVVQAFQDALDTVRSEQKAILTRYEFNY